MNHIEYPIKYPSLIGLIYMLMASLFSVISWPFHLFNTLYLCSLYCLKENLQVSEEDSMLYDDKEITFCKTCV